MRLKRSQNSLTLSAPAKLNLFLEVHKKRTDGYHELETVMTSVRIYDTLHFSEDQPGKTTLHCLNADHHEQNNVDKTAQLPAHHDNLVIQAIELLRRETGTNRGVQATLVKRIPIASGMAGGSSDAAATLAGLNQLWELGLPTATLMQLAAQLGSDVAFFLNHTAAAICRGRGEQIEPINIPLNLWFVIVRPRTGLSTPAVFKQCQPSQQPRQVNPLLNHLRQGNAQQIGDNLFNALQFPAEQLNSDIFELKKAFSNLPVLGHLMTGSGTAYFGLCTTSRQAKYVAARLSHKQLGRVWLAKSGP